MYHSFSKIMHNSKQEVGRIIKICLIRFTGPSACLGYRPLQYYRPLNQIYQVLSWFSCLVFFFINLTYLSYINASYFSALLIMVADGTHRLRMGHGHNQLPGSTEIEFKIFYNAIIFSEERLSYMTQNKFSSPLLSW